MGFNVARGTGRACCKVCDKPILKGEMRVEFYGYKVSQQAHLSCITGLAEEIEFKEKIEKYGEKTNVSTTL